MFTKMLVAFAFLSYGTSYASTTLIMSHDGTWTQGAVISSASLSNKTLTVTGNTGGPNGQRLECEVQESIAKAAGVNLGELYLMLAQEQHSPSLSSYLFCASDSAIDLSASTISGKAREISIKQ